MNGYILISLFWIGYFFLHSLLASERVKSFFGYPKWYRLGYSFLSSILLVPVFIFLATSESFFVFQKAPVTDFIAFVFATYGIIIIKMSFKYYGLKEFIGLKNDEVEALVKDGILSKIRHPIYAGIILLVIGFVLYIPKAYNLLSAFWILLYLPVGIWLEERKLVRKYGKQYEEYRKRVPAIFPKLVKNN